MSSRPVPRNRSTIDSLSNSGVARCGGAYVGVFSGYDLTLDDAAPAALPGLHHHATRDFVAATSSQPRPKFGWTDVFDSPNWGAGGELRTARRGWRTVVTSTMPIEEPPTCTDAASLADQLALANSSLSELALTFRAWTSIGRRPRRRHRRCPPSLSSTSSWRSEPATSALVPTTCHSTPPTGALPLLAVLNHEGQIPRTRHRSPPGTPANDLRPAVARLAWLRGLGPPDPWRVLRIQAEFVEGSGARRCGCRDRGVRKRQNAGIRS